MKKLVYLLLIFLTIDLAAQNTFEITGKIINNDGQPASSATVKLMSLPDSSVKTGTYTDKKGGFKLNSVAGNYFIKISYIGFKDTTTSSFNLRSDKNLGTIELSPSEVTTQDIIVEGEKEFMEMELDRKVFNIHKDSRNKGRNASDILDNLPSVNVDVEGNVSLRGSEQVRILVDGKPSGLVGRDPEALRQLMGDMIEKIEVVTNPSAKYDAQGEVGIINIVLKKEKERGLHAGLEMNSGVPDHYGLSANGNYRFDMVNIFGSLGLSWRKSPGSADAVQEFFDYETIAKTTTKRDQRRGGFGSHVRLGTDVYLDLQNIITFEGIYHYGSRDNFAELTYNDYTEDNALYQKIIRTDREAEGRNDVQLSFQYKHLFPGEKHELFFDSKFEQDKDLEESEITENNLSFDDEDIDQRTSNLEFERNQLYQLDYTYPFSEDGKFEAGAKATMRKIDNDFWVKQLQNGSWDYLPNFNDKFIYFEDIYAAYLMAGNKRGNFGWQLGLRTEYSDITTKLKNADSNNYQSYVDFFPTVHFTYKLTDEHSTQISYSRRIDRPYFRRLMPFSNYTDPRNFSSGNPDLTPEYIDSYEAGYILNKSKLSLLSNVYYRHSSDIILRVISLQDDGSTLTLPFNIGTEDAYGAELNVKYEPLDWLVLTTDLNFYRSVIDGNTTVDDLDSETWTWYGKLTSKLKLFYDIDFELTFDYRAPKEVPQGKRKSMWFMDFGLTRDFLDNTFTVTLSGRDVFNTRMRRVVLRGQNFTFDQDFNWHTGQVLLIVNYRFNKGKEEDMGQGTDDGGW